MATFTETPSGIISTDASGNKTLVSGSNSGWSNATPTGGGGGAMTTADKWWLDPGAPSAADPITVGGNGVIRYDPTGKTTFGQYLNGQGINYNPAPLSSKDSDYLVGGVYNPKPIVSTQPTYVSDWAKGLGITSNYDPSKNTVTFTNPKGQVFSWKGGTAPLPGMSVENDRLIIKDAATAMKALGIAQPTAASTTSNNEIENALKKYFNRTQVSQFNRNLPEPISWEDAYAKAKAMTDPQRMAAIEAARIKLLEDPAMTGAKLASRGMVNPTATAQAQRGLSQRLALALQQAYDAGDAANVQLAQAIQTGDQQRIQSAQQVALQAWQLQNALQQTADQQGINLVLDMMKYIRPTQGEVLNAQSQVVDKLGYTGASPSTNVRDYARSVGLEDQLQWNPDTRTVQIGGRSFPVDQLNWIGGSFNNGTTYLPIETIKSALGVA